MTVILPENYHAREILETNRIQCIARDQASQQDIRPMRIGILNIMPYCQDYEFNILHPLGLSIIQVDPIWIRLKSHNYSSSDLNHINFLYMSYQEAIREEPLDGLIITGAPVEKMKFEEVRYWDEISEILQHSYQNCPSTLGICWGGLALAYLQGIDKFTYGQKLFGVYPLKSLMKYHPITGELDDEFLCPQSRHAGFSDIVMEQAQTEGKLELLAYHESCGYAIFETPDHRFVMHLGHPEYNSQRMVDEAKRDAEKPDVLPPENFDLNNPVNRWRSHRNLFFGQWLKYCYTCVSVPPTSKNK